MDRIEVALHLSTTNDTKCINYVLSDRYIIRMILDARDSATYCNYVPHVRKEHILIATGENVSKITIRVNEPALNDKHGCVIISNNETDILLS